MVEGACMPYDAGQVVAATGAAASCVEDTFKVCLNSAVGTVLTDIEREALEVFLLTFFFI